jgi:predicted PurR-regulated permease PerM
MTNQRLTLSLTNIVLLLILPLLLILLWQLRSLILVLMIAVVISATLAPAVNATQKLGIPRLLAVLSVYAGLIATLTGFGLIIGPLALGLGVIAGFTNLIPFFGPVLGAIPALIVAISQGELTFVWVLLLFIIVQNLETYVLDPLLVGSSVKVSPLYQLLAVLGGTQVLGIIGALIVPPWIAGMGVLLENLYVKPKLIAEGHNETVSSDQ